MFLCLGIVLLSMATVLGSMNNKNNKSNPSWNIIYNHIHALELSAINYMELNPNNVLILNPINAWTGTASDSVIHKLIVDAFKSIQFKVVNSRLTQKQGLHLATAMFIY